LTTFKNIFAVNSWQRADPTP